MASARKSILFAVHAQDSPKKTQRGAGGRDFLEMIVVAMLSFSLGLAVGAMLCAASR